jgi:hypothetical protein
MEGLLLAALGGSSGPRTARPQMRLSDLDNLTSFLQIHAIEKSTVKGYATGARDYITFCVNHSLPLDPTPRTLSRYIAYTSQFIASAPKYLTGARHFLSDLYPSFDTNRAHPLVQATIAGSKKIRADPVKRKLPLRLCHLQAFLEVVNCSNSYDDLLFAAIVSCCFYACHRTGELIMKNDKTHRDWRKIIKRSSVHFSHERAGYHLPYHKGDRFFRGTDIVFTKQDIANPTDLLLQYVRRRDALHGEKPALFLREHGGLSTRSWFESKFFKILDRSYGGHSPRAGGATYYASIGLSEDIIQALGRWTSQAWKDYIRDNPAIRAELQLAHIRHHLRLLS